MSRAAAAADAAVALQLFLRHPARFGAIVLRGDGPAREAMVAYAQATMARDGPVVRIPANVDLDRLLGGLDLSATLAVGRGVTREGLLASATGGVVILSMADRVQGYVAAPLAQALDSGLLAAILLDDAREPDEAPPALLLERAAFHCDVGDMRAFVVPEANVNANLGDVAPLNDNQCRALADSAAALGITSVRPLLFAASAARAHALLRGRAAALDEDVAAAVRLVFSPRATRLPPQEAPPPEPEQSESDRTDQEESDSRPFEDVDLDDILLDAATAAIPPHILDQMAGPAKRSGKGQAGRAGAKQKSAQRGRPLGSRAGVPGQGKRLALIDTLRAAAPWQTIRRNAAPADDRRTIHIRKNDLRVRHYEQRAESLTIFAVDASGSSALSRLAEAKGAVELMLAQAYVKRSQVALIAFRQAGAEILLPPTRSLTRARRALAALPGGGGTPLAAGLLAAQALAEAAAKRGQTPTIAMLTDGKGNVAMDGSANRTVAATETEAAATALRLAGINSVVIDISPRPREEAAALAAAMGGRYLPLPYAQSAAMVAAIENL